MAAIARTSSISVDQALMEIDRLNKAMEETGLPPQHVFFKCKSSGEDPQKFEKLVNKVFSFVCKVYTLFPQLGTEARRQLEEKGVLIDKKFNQSDLPTKEECELFELNLKAKITAVFEKNLELDQIILTTDWLPEAELNKVCQASFSQGVELKSCFPHKTSSYIELNSKRTRLNLAMNFLVTQAYTN